MHKFWDLERYLVQIVPSFPTFNPAVGAVEIDLKERSLSENTPIRCSLAQQKIVMQVFTLNLGNISWVNFEVCKNNMKF